MNDGWHGNPPAIPAVTRQRQGSLRANWLVRLASWWLWVQ